MLYNHFTMSDQPIRSVSDTALWVAYYRAMESERPDAHFRDPYARRLAGEGGERIVEDLRQGRRMAWVMVLRTGCIDELIPTLLTQGVDTVLRCAAWVALLDYGLGFYGHRTEDPATLGKAFTFGQCAHAFRACRRVGFFSSVGLGALGIPRVSG